MNVDDASLELKNDLKNLTEKFIGRLDKFDELDDTERLLIFIKGSLAYFFGVINTVCNLSKKNSPQMYRDIVEKYRTEINTYLDDFK